MGKSLLLSMGGSDESRTEGQSRLGGMLVLRCSDRRFFGRVPRARALDSTPRSGPEVLPRRERNRPPVRLLSDRGPPSIFSSRWNCIVLPWPYLPRRLREGPDRILRLVPCHGDHSAIQGDQLQHFLSPRPQHPHVAKSHPKDSTTSGACYSFVRNRGWRICSSLHPSRNPSVGPISLGEKGPFGFRDS